MIRFVLATPAQGYGNMFLKERYANLNVRVIHVERGLIIFLNGTSSSGIPGYETYKRIGTSCDD